VGIFCRRLKSSVGQAGLERVAEVPLNQHIQRTVEQEFAKPVDQRQRDLSDLLFGVSSLFREGFLGKPFGPTMFRSALAKGTKYGVALSHGGQSTTLSEMSLSAMSDNVCRQLQIRTLLRPDTN
jgi:hypothetical protein